MTTLAHLETVADCGDLSSATLHRLRTGYLDWPGPGVVPACTAGDDAASAIDKVRAANNDRRTSELLPWPEHQWRGVSAAWALSRGAGTCTTCFPDGIEGGTP